MLPGRRLAAKTSLTPVRRPRLQRHERRQQLLAVARDLLSTEGLSAVTMERVAAKADISKPVLYSHFANRAALLLAMLEHLWADLDRAVGDRLRSCTSFDEQLEAFVAGYFDAIRESGPALQLLASNQSDEPLIEEARRRRQRNAEAVWSEIYQQKMGLSKPVADAAAAILRSAIEGATNYWMRSPRNSRELSSSVCLTLFRGGLEALGSQQSTAKSGTSKPARAAAN
jgi:AcrR family transcriptional regulator